MEADETLHPPSAAFFDLPFDWKSAIEAWNLERGLT